MRLWQSVDSSFLSSMLPWDQRGLGPTRVCWRSSRSVWCWRWLKGGGCTCRGRHRRDISDADCFTFALSYLGYRFADRSEMECDFRERRKLYVCTLCDKLISFFRKITTYIIFEIGNVQFVKKPTGSDAWFILFNFPLPWSLTLYEQWLRMSDSSIWMQKYKNIDRLFMFFFFLFLFFVPTIELDIFERFCHRVHGVGAEIEGKAQNSFFYIVSVIVELPWK